MIERLRDTIAVSRPSVASMSAWIAGSSAPGTLYSSLAGMIMRGDGAEIVALG